MHMNLVSGFFKNASHMLRENGEVHVNHKTTPPFNKWNIEKLAEQSFLIMIECADFKQEDYPGYNNKRGHRYRCDDPFPLGKCSTFKFIFNPKSVKDHLRRNHIEVSRQQMTNLPFQEIQNMERFPAPVELNYHPRTRPPFEVIHNIEQIPAPVDHNYHPQTVLVQTSNQLDYYPQTSRFPKRNETEMHGRVACSADCYARDMTQDTNAYNTISNSVADIHGRVDSSADYYRYARDMTQDSQRLLQPMESSYNQSLQQWPTPTNCRLCLTQPRRRMDVAPSMPLGARNDGYHQYQVFERSSTYLEEVYRNAQRSSFLYGIARHDLERYNAEVSRRDFRRREIYVIQ